MTTRDTGAGDPVERTEDGRYIVVGGRRWRASDPAIPEALRAELVAELMTARRQVRVMGERARPAVHDAKVALGERGEPWWEDATDDGRRARIGATIRALLRHRTGGTICPSEAARIVGGPEWRDGMPVVRDCAFSLAADDQVVVLQRGEPVSADAKGPIRIGRGGSFPPPVWE